MILTDFVRLPHFIETEELRSVEPVFSLTVMVTLLFPLVPLNVEAEHQELPVLATDKDQFEEAENEIDWFPPAASKDNVPLEGDDIVKEYVAG